MDSEQEVCREGTKTEKLFKSAIIPYCQLANRKLPDGREASCRALDGLTWFCWFCLDDRDPLLVKLHVKL